MTQTESRLQKRDFNRISNQIREWIESVKSGQKIDLYTVC